MPYQVLSKYHYWGMSTKMKLITLYLFFLEVVLVHPSIMIIIIVIIVIIALLWSTLNHINNLKVLYNE